MTSMKNKLSLFFKNIYLDYYEVFLDVRKSARNRPLRASLYGAATVFALNLFRTNEGLRSYGSEIISASSKIAAVPENQRNPISNEYLHEVADSNNKGLLREIDLGFSTIIYKADSRPDIALYRYNCPHMKPTILEYARERLVDIGFSGWWINLDLKMRDYDINEQELNV